MSLLPFHGHLSFSNGNSKLLFTQTKNLILFHILLFTIPQITSTQNIFRIWPIHNHLHLFHHGAVIIFHLNYCNTLLIVLSPFSIYSLQNPKESCTLPFPLYTPQLSSLSPLFAWLATLQTLIFLKFTKHFKVSSLFFLYLEIFARR